MEVLDIIIIAIILVAAIWGIFKGFVSQVISIAALVLGTLCASKFANLLTAKIIEWLKLEISQDTLKIIAFATIFILVVIIIQLIGKGIENLVKITTLGWVNRLLGLLFGALKAVIILGIAFSVINHLNGMFHLLPDDLFKDSKVCTLLENFTKDFFPFLNKLFS